MYIILNQLNQQKNQYLFASPKTEFMEAELF